jgi:DNA-binding transcriptional regulator of glucitol operon
VTGFRFLLRPGWVALSVLTVALVVTMVLLGHWQLDVSDRKHFSLQNFGYALQWWAFSIFTLAMWIRLVRDHVRSSAGSGAPAEQRPAADAPVAYRRYVPPAPASVDDPELAAYNDYLAGLAEPAQSTPPAPKDRHDHH